MKKIVLLAAFLLVGYVGQSQVYRIATEGESKQFVITDTVSGVRERPYLNREVLADTTSNGTIKIYRQLTSDDLIPIGFPKPKGHPYTAFLDGNNSDATFESAAAVDAWFKDNTGFNSAGGSASSTDGIKYKATSYAALSALSSPGTGDVAVVTGSGIAGTFVYDSTLSATDNGGTIIDGWVRQYEGSISVKWFGAKGDGVTDDTEAIQSAISSTIYAIRTWQPQNLTEGGGGVHFPLGEYLVTNTLLYQGGLTIYGDGVMSSRIKFAPTTLKSLFEGDPDRMTRTPFQYDSTTFRDISFSGDAVGGNNANICLDLEHGYKFNIERCNIYNFETGMYFGESAYYVNIYDTEWRGLRTSIKAVGSTGPININGGSFYANATEWTAVVKRMDCFVENNSAAKITITNTSAEAIDVPVNDGFVMFRGDVAGTDKVGPYVLNGTYHENFTGFIVEIDDTRHYGESFINPMYAYSSLLKIRNFNSTATESFAFASGAQFPQKVTRFGTGKKTNIIQNSMFKNGKYLPGNPNAALSQDTSDKFFSQIPTLGLVSTTTATGFYPYYYDVPIAKIKEYEGRYLTFNVIDKVGNGNTHNAVQIYINGTSQFVKQTSKQSVDYSNGYYMRTISVYIPVGNDATSMRVAIRINTVADGTYNLAYLSICADGYDDYKPKDNNDFKYLATAAPTTGSWVVGDKVYNSTPTAGGYEGWVCTTAGSPGTWKTFGAITP